MNEADRDPRNKPPIDESVYGGSAAETGGLYSKDGPATANQEGDTMSEREEEGNPGPESHTDG